MRNCIYIGNKLVMQITAPKIACKFILSILQLETILS